MNLPQAPSSTRPIRFLHRSRVVEVRDVAPTTTVLTWLREHAHCTGTKEGCNEGDCGACTVAVAELDDGGHVQLRNLNACLLFLPALDGRALFTVEDVTACARPATLHPVQQALVDHHASQCGFCTPGFVMTIWAERERALQSGHCPDRSQWADALAGNLCRCTGYRPLLDAAQDCTARSPDTRLDLQALEGPLKALQADPDLVYEAVDPAFGEVRRFLAPRSAQALATHLQVHPGARVLGGATDIALWVHKAHRDVGDLLYTGQAQDLRRIEVTADQLRIGSAANLEDAWGTLHRHWPSLQHLWRRFASPPVRHAGTLGGNVANGSPIGDAPPVLLALDARLLLRRGPDTRVVPLSAFYLGYQRNALQEGEFIERIEVPLARPGQQLRAWKISKRYDSDISAVCGAFGLDFGATGLERARLAFGGMAATVHRASAAEAALLQHGWCEDGIRQAQAALVKDFQPMSDLRATAAMRLQWARALLQRLWLSLDARGQPRTGEQAPVLEVWR